MDGQAVKGTNKIDTLDREGFGSKESYKHPGQPSPEPGTSQKTTRSFQIISLIGKSVLANGLPRFMFAQELTGQFRGCQQPNTGPMAR